MQASVDVRNGLMTRDEGLNMAMTIDKEQPYALDYYQRLQDYQRTSFCHKYNQKNINYSGESIEESKTRNHVN